MIISASRRTDIPTYYSDWFFNRIKEGFVFVRNPMNAHQISRIDLRPDVVDGIVFWTKNPLPMLDRLDLLKEYTYYFQFTLTSYGEDVESNIPSKSNVIIPSFQRLSDKLGPERVIWRYDPIFLSQKYSIDYHIHYFEMLAIAVFVFNIPLGENMLLFFLSFIVIVMIMMLLSLTLHGFFKNSRQAMPFTIIGFQYVLFASGMIMPVENMAKFMQVLVYINPIYHMNQVLINVWFMERPQLVNLLALLGWILVCIVLIRIQKGFAVDK